MKNESQKAEEIYFEVFSCVSERADYLQPGDGISLLLPEVAITSAVTAVFVSLLKGFFGQIGKDLATKLKEVTIGRKKKISQAEPDDLVAALRERLPEIAKNQDKLPEIEVTMRQELISMGFPEKPAQEISATTIQIVSRALNDE